MMFPAFYSTCAASAAVKAVFGDSPRIYPHGMAPDTGSLQYGTPYAVQQIVTGFPANYIDKIPDVDAYTVQVDVYADTVAAAASGAQAIRDAVEAVAYVGAWRGQFKDPDTQLFRYSFDVEFQTTR